MRKEHSISISAIFQETGEVSWTSFSIYAIMVYAMKIENPRITQIVLPMELFFARQADEFVRVLGEKCGLKDRVLFRLAFVVNEIVAGIVQLAKVVGVSGDIEIKADTYTQHITVSITFPGSVPLDPGFDHSDVVLSELPGRKLQPDIFWHHVLLKWVDKATWSRSRKKTTVSLTQYARSEDRAGELYFLSLTPRPSNDLRLSLFSEDVVIAKSSRQETALRLSPQDGFILKSIDGKTPVREIYYSFVKRFGLMHPQAVGSLIEDLVKSGLIVPDEPLGEPHRGKDAKIKRILSRISKLRYTIPKPDSFVEIVNQKIGWLWSGRAGYFYFFFVLASFVFFFMKLPYIRALAGEHFISRLLLHPASWIGFYLGMSINMILHEFSHAIVCKKYGGKVHAIGIMFYYASPCAFVDTTDAWMFENKWHRVMVSLAGPLSSLILTCLYGWVWVLSMHWGFQNLSLISGAVFLVGMLSLFIQFIPFIETDGYYILVDILEMPNLRRNSFSYLRSLLGALLKGKPKPEVSKREARIYLMYSLLALAAIAFLLWFLLHFIKIRLAEYPGILSWILAAILVVLFSERAIRASLNWYRKTHLAPIDLKTAA